MLGLAAKSVSVLGVQTFDTEDNEIPSDDKLTVPFLRYDGTFDTVDASFTGFAGNETITGTTGLSNWPVINPSGDPTQSLSVHNVLDGGAGNDLLQSSVMHDGLTAA